MTTQATTSQTDAVRATLDRLYEAWTANDADAFVAHYREDATVVLAGAFQRGRPAVRDHMARAFAGPYKGSRGFDEPQDIRIIGDTAIVVSRAGAILPGEDAVAPERERLATWVLSQEDGRWLVAAYTNTSAH
jgi:uncharacterized protein (TIGR02246 family)